MGLRNFNRRTWLAASALLLAAVSQPAFAHPHIFIDAEVAVGFDDAGRVASLRNSWTFDTAFSVWMVQGLDADEDGDVSSEELQELADENMVGLADYGFYTYAGNGMAFQAVGDQRMRYQDNRVTLDFSVAAISPEAPRGRFELGIYDPEYYVAISIAEAADVTLEGAPANCAVHLEPPVPMSAAVEERLYSLGPEVLELPPDLAAAMRGTQGMAVVSCGEAPPAGSALEAAAQVAQQKPTAPFGGPPAEVGLDLPRTGFFGWVQTQQREFYAAMTAALDQLRTDWTAFWVLGGLSFLYGVFHAAGPGHGKVVISSYVLANERQLRQGIMLSAVSALLQSVVAIGFVLVLAGVLHLTSTAMGEAAHWVGVVSYAMVVLLGLWLVIRKLSGLGHHHHSSHSHAMHEHHDDSHHHDAHHDHMHHAVGPGDLQHNWREKLGVVLAVGLRPCSGALVVLVFALSQGLLAAGIAAVLLMGLGTAITVAALATLAVSAKGLAARVGGAESITGARIVWWGELLGAFAVLAFGVVLLIAAL